MDAMLPVTGCLVSKRERHQLRAKEIESKRQTVLLLSKKYMEGELRETRQSMVSNYRTAASQASELIPGVVEELNKYLKVRPPIQHI